MIAVEFDPGDIEKRLNALARATGVSVQSVSYGVMADYTEQVMDKATPPKYQKAGKKQIARDLNLLFAGMSKPFAEWVEEEDLDTDSRIDGGARWNMGGNGRQMMAWHKRFRTGKRGGVRHNVRTSGKIGSVEFQNKMYVPKTSLVAFVKHTQARVGRVKKGWLAAVNHWSAKAGRGAYVGWVTRAKGRGREGRAQGEINRRGDGDLVSVNSVPYSDEAVQDSKVALIQQRQQRTIVRLTKSSVDRLASKFNRA